MDWCAYAKLIEITCDDNDSIQTYLFINKIVSEHMERAKQTFDINAKQYEDPLHQLEVVRICLHECAEALYEDWQDRFSYKTALYSAIKKEIVSGPSFVKLTQITSTYYKQEQIATAAYQLEANVEKRNAVRVASSQITGLGFGIISNSIISHLVYMAQSEAAIKQQVQNAEAYIARENTLIDRRMSNRVTVSNRSYYSTHYVPAVQKVIEGCFSDMVMSSVLALAKRNLMDPKIVQGIDYEISQEVLSGIDTSENPEKVIIEALEFCPYNVHAHAEARKRKITNDVLTMAIMKYDLEEALEKEIAFSMLDSDAFEDGFATIIANNYIGRNEDEWQGVAVKHLNQSREIIQKHPDSFAGYGAVAIYLVAANMESNQTAFWAEVNTNLAEFISKYTPSETREKCFTAILDKFRAYITEYFHYSVEYFLNEAGWDYASATKRWQQTASDKRRLIPALHCFAALIDKIKVQLSNDNLVAELSNDLLWCLVMFCKPHFAADSTPSGAILRKYYHIPLSERQFAIDLFDTLLNSSYVTANGRFTANKQKNPKYIEEVFGQYKNEVTEEGKVFFGMKKHEPIHQGTNSPTPKSGGCYIATCVYGSYDCPPVWTLRRFRDDVLQNSSAGRIFVKCYYKISPILVKWFGKTIWFKEMWKYLLNGLVIVLQKHGIDNSAYSDRQ